MPKTCSIFDVLSCADVCRWMSLQWAGIGSLCCCSRAALLLPHRHILVRLLVVPVEALHENPCLLTSLEKCPCCISNVRVGFCTVFWLIVSHDMESQAQTSWKQQLNLQIQGETTLAQASQTGLAWSYLQRFFQGTRPLLPMMVLPSLNSSKREQPAVVNQVSGTNSREPNPFGHGLQLSQPASPTAVALSS